MIVFNFIVAVNSKQLIRRTNKKIGSGFSNAPINSFFLIFSLSLSLLQLLIDFLLMAGGRGRGEEGQGASRLIEKRIGRVTGP